jgi:hypothetical protein
VGEAIIDQDGHGFLVVSGLPALSSDRCRRWSSPTRPRAAWCRTATPTAPTPGPSPDASCASSPCGVRRVRGSGDSRRVWPGRRRRGRSSRCGTSGCTGRVANG